jgi:hypothetical protein
MLTRPKYKVLTVYRSCNLIERQSFSLTEAHYPPPVSRLLDLQNAGHRRARPGVVRTHRTRRTPGHRALASAAKAWGFHPKTTEGMRKIHVASFKYSLRYWGNSWCFHPKTAKGMVEKFMNPCCYVVARTKKKKNSCTK